MRFYDPRAINKYLAILQKDEGRAFFSKIEAIYVEKKEEPETLCIYSLNSNRELEKKEISLEAKA